MSANDGAECIQLTDAQSRNTRETARHPSELLPAPPPKLAFVCSLSAQDNHEGKTNVHRSNVFSLRETTTAMKPSLREGTFFEQASFVLEALSFSPWRVCTRQTGARRLTMPAREARQAPEAPAGDSDNHALNF